MNTVFLLFVEENSRTIRGRYLTVGCPSMRKHSDTNGPTISKEIPMTLKGTEYIKISFVFKKYKVLCIQKYSHDKDMGEYWWMIYPPNPCEDISAYGHSNRPIRGIVSKEFLRDRVREYLKVRSATVPSTCISCYSSFQDSITNSMAVRAGVKESLCPKCEVACE